MGPVTGGGRVFCNIPMRITSAEIDFLKNEMLSLKAQLSEIEARIDYLKSTESKSIERSK